MALGRCLYSRICGHLKCLATFGRGDLPAPAVIRCQNAVVAGEIDPRFWHEGGQSRNELHRIEGHLGCPVPSR
jgi:hypothetical protein